MTLRWYPPLDGLLGTVTELPLDRPTPVARVLADICDREPALRRYARHTERDTRPQGLLLWRRGQILGLGDVLEPSDEVEVLVLVTGG